MPKTLTAIIALVITYTNQIIAVQCFTVFSFLLISISFLISFTLYPGNLKRRKKNIRYINNQYDVRLLEVLLSQGYTLNIIRNLRRENK
jgi:hypothetical protein